MTILTIGLILWIGAHYLKRLAPEVRQKMTDRMGDASKGVFAVVIVLSVVFMVVGYRGLDFIPVYEPPAFLRHVNNLLMLAAIALLGLGSSKSRFRGSLRHPMLVGFSIWAFAHLLVNGDLASVVLFGGLLFWAVVQIVLINRAEPDYQPAEPGTAAGDLKLVVVTVVIFAVISGIHTWLGYPPFGA